MGFALISGLGRHAHGGRQRPGLGFTEFRTTLVGQIAEGDQVQAVAGGANLLIDLKAAL